MNIEFTTTLLFSILINVDATSIKKSHEKTHACAHDSYARAHEKTHSRAHGKTHARAHAYAYQKAHTFAYQKAHTFAYQKANREPYTSEQCCFVISQTLATL
jgi:hypothetical protein